MGGTVCADAVHFNATRAAEMAPHWQGGQNRRNQQSCVQPTADLNRNCIVQVATLRAWTAAEGRLGTDGSKPSSRYTTGPLEALLGPDYVSGFRPTFLLGQML